MIHSRFRNNRVKHLSRERYLQVRLFCVMETKIIKYIRDIQVPTKSSFLMVYLSDSDSETSVRIKPFLKQRG